jgi:hypothetical protein
MMTSGVQDRLQVDVAAHTLSLSHALVSVDMDMDMDMDVQRGNCVSQ